LQYDNHGGVNQDFRRVGAKDVAGHDRIDGPLVVNAQLPASNPLWRAPYSLALGTRK